LGERNALTVKLPYSKDDFGVPNNLYVVGTMNTADRSIALLDTALRRRFHFTEMMPDYACLDKEISGIHLGELLSAINRRVEWLFDRDHQIGHGFFTEIQDKAALNHIMQTKVIPLLAEYFYEDWEKIRVALNDTGGWFIGVERLAAPPMLQEEGEERFRYSIRKGEIPVHGYLAAAELT
jgi:5-methylcytosine-specific restriction protein B